MNKVGRSELLEEEVPGTVKWFNGRFGYGFVERTDQDGKDLFLHITGILKNYPDIRPIPFNGQDIVFDVIQGR